MAIRRGEPWATNGPLAAHAPVVSDDAALRAHVEQARRRGAMPGEIGLLGGDLCATLGGPGRRERLTSDEAVTSSKKLPNSLMKNWSRVPGTRAVRWV